MCKPTISIVTACYNSAAFLARIHGSLVRQTYRNFEWICVDDCSTDDTVARLIELESPGELGMQVYRLPQNTGGPVALAFGTSRASGDIVIWMDHDDELEPFALEQVRSNWPRIEQDRSASALFFRTMNPVDGSMIGRQLPRGSKYSLSELSNRYPDIYDCTFAFKRKSIQRLATVENMEELMLNSVIFFRLTSDQPFVIADSPPTRFYHRDNPTSQTRLERISRKSVATYARLLDQADIHYLRAPVRWVRHGATLLRYSRLVHGRWFAGLRYISRPGIRLFVVAIWPLGLLAYLRRPRANVVEIKHFPEALAADLPNLRLSVSAARNG